MYFKFKIFQKDLSNLRINNLLIILFSLFFLFCPISVYSQDSEVELPDKNSINYIISHLTADDGLSGNAISAIVQDKYGFLWIGTKTGLNRYDGYEFKKYFYQPYNENSLPHNLIQTLFMDKENNDLWIGTYGGLSRFNLDTETFTNFVYSPDNEFSISDNVVVSICKDKYGRLWVGTLHGLNRYDEKNNRFIRYFHNDSNSKSISNDVIRSIYLDSNGRLWIGTYKGLSLYDYKTDSFINYSHNENNKESFPGDFGMSISEDNEGNLWIGTWYIGLVKYDIKNNKFIAYKLPDNRIYKIRFDKKNNLFIVGTWGGGLYVFDVNSLKYQELRNIKNNDNSISGNTIYSIFIDNQNILWVGTFSSGLNKIIIPSNKFSFIEYFKSPVLSMYKDSFGNFWIGTDNNGLFKYNVKTKKYEHYKLNSNDNKSLSNDIINVIFEDSYKNLWIGTNHGLNLYNRKHNNFKRFFHDFNNPDTIADDIVFSIIEDNKKNIWFGTYNNGISVYNPRTKKMKHYFYEPENKNSISNNLIYKLFKDSKGRIWVGTNNGLNLYDEENDKFIKYYYNKNNRQSISSNSILTIYEDSNHFLWIGTRGGGLDKFDPDTGVVKVYNEKNGLVDSEVKGILEDKKNNLLWVITAKGISYIELENGNCKSLSKFNGIIFKDFYKGIYDNKDEFFVGIKNGILIGKYEKIVTNNHIPDIYITKFKVFGKDYKFDLPLTKIKEIKLKHSQKFFSIEFSSLDYFEPEKNEYAYKLIGFDKDWNYINNRHFISYTNLDPGKYILKILGSNNNGLWNEKGLSISIVIVPEWYLTIWAKIVYAILILALLIFVYFFQFNLKLNKAMKKETIKLKNELLTQEEQRKILEAKNKAKDEFFANVTHDIRNPLNSIVSYAVMLRILAKNGQPMKPEKLIEVAGKIEKVTFELASMLNNILEISKLKSGKVRVLNQKINLKSFLNLIYEISFPNAKIKNIGFNITFNRGLPEFIFSDKEKLKRILINLVDNAIKYTEQGKVEIDVYPSFENTIKISIKDTGIGIPDEFKKLLFSEWERADNVKNKIGYGLGLSIVNKYVELLDSKLEYKENKPNGSIFILTIPVGMEDEN